MLASKVSLYSIMLFKLQAKIKLAVSGAVKAIFFINKQKYPYKQIPLL